jgi:Flp pilus assembly pilin Flp
MLGWLSLSIRQLRRDNRGISALEYGVLLAVVAGVIITAFGDPVSGLFPQFFGAVFNGVTSQFNDIS